MTGRVVVLVRQANGRVREVRRMAVVPRVPGVVPGGRLTAALALVVAEYWLGEDALRVQIQVRQQDGKRVVCWERWRKSAAVEEWHGNQRDFFMEAVHA